MQTSDNQLSSPRSSPQHLDNFEKSENPVKMTQLDSAFGGHLERKKIGFSQMSPLLEEEPEFQGSPQRAPVSQITIERCSESIKGENNLCGGFPRPQDLHIDASLCRDRNYFLNRANSLNSINLGSSQKLSQVTFADKTFAPRAQSGLSLRNLKIPKPSIHRKVTETSSHNATFDIEMPPPKPSPFLAYANHLSVATATPKSSPFTHNLQLAQQSLHTGPPPEPSLSKALNVEKLQESLMAALSEQRNLAAQKNYQPSAISLSLHGRSLSGNGFKSTDSLAHSVSSSGSTESSKSSSSTKRVRMIMSSLPDRLCDYSNNEGMMLKRKKTSSASSKYMLQRKPVKNPHSIYIEKLKAKGIEATVRPSLSVENYFRQPTPKDFEAYDKDIIAALRAQDIPTLRKMYHEGRSMQCCNSFGESLIHMACRRGFTDIVRFLIEETGVTIRVRDDYGRTPIHDACWTPEPNFDLMDLLVSTEPDLLLMSDKRGHTPLQYVRKEHWETWNSFLSKRDKMIIPKQFAVKKIASSMF